MEFKLIGALLLVLGGGCVGMIISAVHRREIYFIRQLLSVINFMECELQYNLTALPSLCRQASNVCSGALCNILNVFAGELDHQICANAPACMVAVVEKNSTLTPHARECILQLGQSLGAFELQGQLRSLEHTRKICNGKLNQLETDKEVRLRSYKTIGLCAGAALAILLI